MKRKSLSTPSALSRRELLWAGTMGVGAAVLTGCGGDNLLLGGTNPGGLGARTRRVALGSATVPLANDIDGTGLFYTFGFADTGIQGVCWGNKDAKGVAKSTYEILAWDQDVQQGSRVLFDASGLPIRVIRELNGAYMTVFWGTTDAIFKFYQSDGSYLGGADVALAGTTYHPTQLADSAVVGHYSGTLDTAKDGIFSITVGAAAAPKVKTNSRQVHLKGGVSPRAVVNTTKDRLAAILSLMNDATYSQFAKTLLAQIGSEYFSAGKSTTFLAIVQVALKNTGKVGLFDGDSTNKPDQAVSILRGLTVPASIRLIVGGFKSVVDVGGKVPADQLFDAEQTPVGAEFVSKAVLKDPKATADKTSVNGVMSSRDFGSVSVTGVVDAGGNFRTQGSKGNDLFFFNGNVTATTLTGTWRRQTITRQTGGGASGTQTPLGQCQQAQLSGNQGLFQNQYDVGGCGKFTFNYDAFTIPDGFDVINAGQNIFSTGGLVSGSSSAQLSTSSTDTMITVVVTASESGTAWTYTVGCATT